MLKIATARELIAHLEYAIEQAGGDPNVSVHFQPGYPLQAGIVNVTVLADGTVAIALAEATEYGQPAAWEAPAD